MKVKLDTTDSKSQVTFIPETLEEKRIMGTLRSHFFFGVPENGTYPEYAGIETEGQFVTSLTLEYNKFK